MEVNLATIRKIEAYCLLEFYAGRNVYLNGKIAKSAEEITMFFDGIRMDL